MCTCPYRSTAPFLGGDTQFHFDSIDVQKIALRVSMHTNSNLPQDLKRIRSSLVLPIVKFEAPILLGKSIYMYKLPICIF